MMQITDIKAVAETVSGNNVIVCVDNTFATPMLQQPLSEGADFGYALCYKIFGWSL